MYEFRLPDIGEGVAQGEVVKWHVKVGDAVREDQPLLSVLTDKANVEIPCPVQGKVTALHAQEGQVVPVGSLLVTFETEGKAPPPAAHGVAAAPPPPAATPASPPPAPSATVVTTPAIRRRANELGVDLRLVPGTGPSGRIVDADLDRFVKGGGKAPPPAAPGAPPAPPVPASPLGVARAAIPSPPQAPLVTGEGAPLQERVPIRGLRRTIAEHMALAKSRAAHFTYVEEIDVSELVRVRERAKKRMEEKGVPLTYLPFIVKSVVESLKDHPTLNALMDDEKGELVVCHYYHIGVATAAPDGLIVPVVKNADHKSIATIAKEIEDLSARGRAGKLSREELTGSTFTISSLGALGGVLATPILNYPEVAILGVHKIEKKPVVLADGTIGIGHRMNLSISLDHRVVDGYVGAQFLAAVKGRLEDPHQLLLELR